MRETPPVFPSPQFIIYNCLFSLEKNTHPPITTDKGKIVYLLKKHQHCFNAANCLNEIFNKKPSQYVEYLLFIINGNFFQYLIYYLYNCFYVQKILEQLAKRFKQKSFNVYIVNVCLIILQKGIIDFV